jgi:hypothetical protein
MKAIYKSNFYFYLLVFISSFVCIGQNNFENGLSPSTYRYFFPDKRDGDYKMMMFQTEGLDGINYFGNRLQDINLDGKIDYVFRVKEYLNGEWDFPSTEPRMFIRGEINKDFEMKLVKEDMLFSTAENIKYFEDETGEYFYNWAWYDPTIISQIGIDDWKGFLKKYNYIENEDYAYEDKYIEFKPRIYRTKNGVFKDVTNENLEFVQEIASTRAKFPWDQSISSGDFDGDGDTDILMSGIHGATSTSSGLPNYNPKTRLLFYFFENDGKGNLKGIPLNLKGYENIRWSIPEGTKQYATNIDNIPGDEAIGELWEYEGVFEDNPKERKFGYYKINKVTREIEFQQIFKNEEYLLNPFWNIFPKQILPIKFINNRELVLYFFTSPSGSPAKNFIAETRFDQKVVQQYFKVYEFIKNSNGLKEIKEVTKEFFLSDEDKTFSLDNSGTIHFIDVDGDGLLDLFPQIGHTPYDVLGGIQQFINYPSWNGKTNTVYFFKQLQNNTFKLTDLTEIKGRYFPQNFNGDYSLFNNNGKINDNDGSTYIENFTVQNNVSLNDLNEDGRLEIITSANPDYLQIFTKSNLPVTGLEELKIESSTISILSLSNIHDRYDFSEYTISKDTLHFKLHDNFSQAFIIKDPKKIQTHVPMIYGAYSKKTAYSVSPPPSNRSEIVDNTGQSIMPVFNRRYFPSYFKDQFYELPFFLRKNNDFVLKSHTVFTIDQNIAPLPFKLLAAKKIEENGFKGFIVDLSISVDINNNTHQSSNGKIEPGLKYGYELYSNGILIKTVKEVSYSTVEIPNSFLSKIKDFKISIDQLPFDNIRFKIFAIDSSDDKIITYATIPDSDFDGIIDVFDKCPNTKVGVAVDSNGCSTSQIDTDNDGVNDNIDLCPNTPSGQTVNSNGCSTSQIDTDNDGVKNNIDLCPNTPSGQTVNSDGCSTSQIDTDNDGVKDNIDLCPNTPSGQTVNSNGCSTSQIDTDNDGVKDNIDLCPNTPSGQTVNSDGCILIPYNNFLIETKSETCSGKNNGVIIIKATLTYDYKATINNKTYSFENNSLTISNLQPGVYNVCLEVVGEKFQQCYTLTIGKGGTLTGKITSISKNSVNVEITEGTAPFEISINGSTKFNTNQSNFSVDVTQGDLILVKSSVACEGIYSKTISDLPHGIVAYPNPTKGIFEMSVPSNLNEVYVEVFSINSDLISKQTYPVVNNKIKLNIENQSKGVYIVKTYLDSPVSIIIIKD